MVLLLYPPLSPVEINTKVVCLSLYRKGSRLKDLGRKSMGKVLLTYHSNGEVRMSVQSRDLVSRPKTSTKRILGVGEEYCE